MADGGFSDKFEEFAWYQRSAALGCVVGGLAHELNNVFGRILGYSELTLEEENLSEDVREGLVEIRDSIIYVTEFSRWLGRFSRRRSSVMASYPVVDMVDRAIQLLRPEFKAGNVRLFRDEENDWSGRVLIDDVLLVQALVLITVVLRRLAPETHKIEFQAARGAESITINVSAQQPAPAMPEIEKELEQALSEVETSSPGCPRTVEQVFRSFGLAVPLAVVQHVGGDIKTTEGGFAVILPLV